ncbi:MAG: hypothetical protein HQ559_01520 [Lentisphaerae bacterium]|nr:hypothetical protein [Lentisphaerota bacterium]
MSAICGFFNLADEPARPDLLEPMLDTLAPYGGDGQGRWVEGPIALGQEHFDVETADFRCPLLSEDRSLVLVSDCRIDNRDDLAAELGLDSREADGRFILRAYKKWGEQCPQKLIGEFAFALWDSRKRTLLCCVDHMGQRGLRYALTNNVFVFASTCRGVMAHPSVSHDVNLRQIAAMGSFTAMLDRRDETFFSDVKALNGSTLITVSREGIRSTRYWDPSDETTTIRSKEESFEGLRTVLFDSVRARLRGGRPVAALLSGGLDSSSVAAVAAKVLEERGETLLTLSSHTAEGDGPDEKPFVETFRDWPNVNVQYANASGMGPFDDIDAALERCEAPALTSRHYLYTAFGKECRKRGIRVLFDGLGGELGATFHGQGCWSELLLSGRWLALIRDMRQLAKRERRSTWKLFRGSCLAPLVPGRLRQVLGRGARFDLRQMTAQNPVRDTFVREILGRSRTTDPCDAETIGRVFPNGRRNKESGIRFAQGASGTTIMSGAGVLQTYPFVDVRLLRLCLAVPSSVHSGDGYRRYFIRRALDGILPPAIQWRTSKTPFSPDYHTRYNRSRGKAMEILDAVPSKSRIPEILDMDRLKQLASYEMDNARDDGPQQFAAMHILPMGVYIARFLTMHRV